MRSVLPRPCRSRGSETSSHRRYGGWPVPRRELAPLLHILLKSRRIKVSPSLPEAQTLVQELTTFQVKAAVGKEDAMDWRLRPHDDLVLACAIAAWLGERCNSNAGG